MKEEELEFISVSNEDDNDMNTTHYVDPLAPNRSNNSAIGNWFLNQSKVKLCLHHQRLLEIVTILVVIIAPISSVFSFIVQIPGAMVICVW